MWLNREIGGSVGDMGGRVCMGDRRLSGEIGGSVREMGGKVTEIVCKIREKDGKFNLEAHTVTTAISFRSGSRPFNIKKGRHCRRVANTLLPIKKLEVIILYILHTYDLHIY